MRRKLLATVLAVTMAMTMLTGCGQSAGDTAATGSAGTETKTETTKEDTASGEQITLKVFSNLPDRKNGQGLVEQTIIDEYMAENPNVTIEVEALDEEAYKTKFKAYSMEGMPDVVSIWG